MKYRSIYDYLDEVFSKKKNPSKEEIVRAKEEYWKLYFRNYHKQRRKYRKEFTLGFDQKTLLKIKEKKGSQTFSKFLYQSVLKALESNDILNGITQEILADIQQQLMIIISSIEESLLEENKELAYDAISQLEELELKIHKIQNDDN